MTKVSIELTVPYSLTVEQLKESREEDADHWSNSLEWIAAEASVGEAMRILTTAMLLLTVGGNDLDVALYTAIVMERG